MKRRLEWLFTGLVVVSIISYGCSSASSKTSPLTNKEMLTYEDVIQSLKSYELQPKESSLENKFTLNNVQAQTVKLKNGNIMDVYVFKSSEAAVRAHSEFYEKTATIDFIAVPQVYPIKNLLVIYYDYQISDFLQSL